MEVGKRITLLKEQRGLTTNKLAIMAGIAQSALRSIEKGEKSPTMDTLDLILKALEIEPLDFFSIDLDTKIKKQEAEEVLPLVLDNFKNMNLSNEEKYAYEKFLNMENESKIKTTSSVMESYNALPEQQQQALKIIIDSLRAANHLQ